MLCLGALLIVGGYGTFGSRLVRWLISRRWTAFGIPLPGVLAPYGDTYEHLEDGRFCFHVEIALPLIGLIVRYQGHLTPCPEGVSPAGKR